MTSVSHRKWFATMLRLGVHTQANMSVCQIAATLHVDSIHLRVSIFFLLCSICQHAVQKPNFPY